MASTVFTGTATSHTDLLSKIVTHLTTGLGSQNWQLLKSHDQTNLYDRYLRAPGLSGTDNIYVNLRIWENAGADSYFLNIRGAVNFNTSVPMESQPGTSPEAVIPIWNNAMPYWLIANGRRLIIIAKVSTTYQTGYAGFYFPYSTSGEMPYPLAVMGSACDSGKRWSTGNYNVGGFFDPTRYSSYIRHWDGAWVTIANYNNRTDFREEYSSNVVWPFHTDYNIGRNRDGSYGILPAILHGDYSAVNVYGELEGVYQVSGFGAGSEDILTIGGDQYLIVQSVYRTSRRDYAAIKLG